MALCPDEQGIKHANKTTAWGRACTTVMTEHVVYAPRVAPGPLLHGPGVGVHQPCWRARAPYTVVRVLGLSLFLLCRLSPRSWHKALSSQRLAYPETGAVPGLGYRRSPLHTGVTSGTLADSNRHARASGGPRFGRKVRFLGQNPKIGCQEFNGLETPQLSNMQLCDRTLMLPGSTTTHENRIYKATPSPHIGLRSPAHREPLGS